MTQFRKGGYASRPDSPGIMELLSRGEFVITSMNPYPKWYLDAVSELNRLPDPWLRIWAIHFARTTHMTMRTAVSLVRVLSTIEDEQHRQILEAMVRQQPSMDIQQMWINSWDIGRITDNDLRARWRGPGLQGAMSDIRFALHDLKRAVWQAIPQPVRDFYSRHERILYPCAAVSLLVLVLVGIFGPQFVD